ncbi:MAG: hypothetical protein D6705_03230 [Deltaproteobacteria bacterium]|nr:MAG: hypothetical protein D6705_03230 [Deltaproteobacteria bacterium]
MGSDSQGSGSTTATDGTTATAGSTGSTGTGGTDGTAGSTGATTTGSSDTGTGGTGGSTGGTATGGSTGGGTTGGVACECTPGLDDGIFVLSDGAEIWKYVPDMQDPQGPGTFSKVGDLNCGGNSNTFSMAVDRNGFAWIMFGPTGPNAGDIWKADLTNNATCTDPGYMPGQQGVNLFGMAFVSNSEFDACDKLYGNTYDGMGPFGEGPNAGTFLSVDPDTLVLSTIAPTNYNGAELTGTGDGRAFMFAGVPAKLIEIDKTNGQVIDTWDLGLSLTNAFAFAFFGGDFYLFTESDGNPTKSKVSWFDFDDSEGQFATGPININNDAPIRIVGAGVSTCAPIGPQ